jgi:asparagine synthase (glutamine-hydrolysing)
MLIYEVGRITEKVYWKCKYVYDKPEKSDSYYIDHFCSILKAAISKRINRYPDAGVFLSGSLDSSTVVTIMSELNDQQFKVFTAAFEEKSWNEVNDTKIVDDHLGLKHHIIKIKFKRSFPDLLEKLVWLYDAPFGDTSAIPTYFAAKLAKDHTDTLITGDLPGQLFGGSDHHINIPYREKHDPIWKKILRKKRLNNIIIKLSLRAGEATISDKIKRLLYRETFPLEEQRILLGMPIPPLFKNCLYSAGLLEINKKDDPLESARSLYSEADSEVLLDKLLYFDTLSGAPDGLMVKVERMTAAHGLNVTSPFRDMDFVEFVSALLIHLKVCGENRKYILR